MIEYLAKISGNKFVRINNHEHTDLQEYLGSYVSDHNGRLRYQEGVLVEALRNGYWLVLDELNLAPTDVLEALNRLLDDNRELFLPETQETIRPHPQFILFATQNPAGLYGGRKPLSRAFRNRFLELHFDDIPEDELERILTERSQIAPSFCTRIVAVYKKLSVLRQSSRVFEQRNSFATLRDLFRWALRRADDRQQLSNNGFMLLAERVRDPAERDAVKAVIEEVMRVTIDEEALYSASNIVTRAMTVRSSDIVWTPAMRRLLVLVSQALEHNEPVLLVGETGCGKTQLCQVVAKVYEKRLHTVNVHSNTETGDLIGAQRPVRNRAWLEEQLREDLLVVLSDMRLDFSEHEPIEKLLNIFDDVQIQEKRFPDSPVVTRIQQYRVQLKSLFTWTDGDLVTAMKNGQHFLLDEISLADDSVLERLNSVLETNRTLILAEKGVDGSNVIASQGFQFLATMNPGGDYGKRELSAALRNRLTEIWVPPLSDEADILPILQAKLPLGVSGIHQAMIRFARWFKGTFHNSAPSSIALRDLLAWVSFVKIYSDTNLYFGLVHGAATVYIDTIGANPAALLAVSSTSIHQARQECIDKLSVLFNKDVAAIYNEPAIISDREDSIVFGHFPLPKVPTCSKPPEFIFEAPTTKVNAMRVVRALQLSKPILLEGSPGAGKTTLVNALATAAGRKLTRINLSDQTDLVDLFGSDVPTEGADIGHFTWRDASFLRAMQRGEWVLLDEMNLASQSVLEGLNSCLDHRNEVFVAELGQTFSCHPGFVLFAAQNSHHQGGGRKGLPTSFVNRFTVVYTDALQDNDLHIISQQLFPTIPEVQMKNIITFVSAIRELANSDHRFGSLGGPWELNLRDITRWLSLVDSCSGGHAAYQFVDTVITQRFRTAADRSAVTKLAEHHIDLKSDHRSYFHNLAPAFYQVGCGVIERDRLHQWMQGCQMSFRTSDLPTVESLLLCIHQKWPSVLVGPSGCGKTNILRSLAAVSGARLVELAMNSDTDAMDLVGGFDQFDVTQEISQLRGELESHLRTRIATTTASFQATDELEDDLQVYKYLVAGDVQWEDLLSSMLSLSSRTDLKGYLQRLQSLVPALNIAQAPHFTWTDGLLVEALRQGHWVVLDNANLCDASVLDRLNSLLEPAGSLIINEHHSEDGSPVVLKPHKDFRIFLTMDPRNGELSRAMRNRAVELHLQSSNAAESAMTTPSYCWESSTSRLKSLLQVTSLNCNPKETEHTLEVALGHLSIGEVEHIGRFQRDLLAILCDAQEPRNAALVLKTFAKIFRPNNQSSLPRFIKGFHRAIQDHDAFPAALLNAQPIDPLSNVPCIVHSMSYLGGAQIERAARLYDTHIELANLRNVLESVANGAESCRISDMTLLQRSAMSQRLPALRKDSTKHVFKFVQATSLAADACLTRIQETEHDANVIHAVASLFAYCRDMLSLTDTFILNDGIFAIILQTGNNLAKQLTQTDVPARELGARFGELLSGFNAVWKLSSGLSLERMWNVWRPATPNDLAKLAGLSEVESAASRFDSLIWRLQLPLSQITNVRASLLGAQELVLSDDTINTVPIRELGERVTALEASVEDDAQPNDPPFLQRQFMNLCQYGDLATFEFAVLADSSRTPEPKGALEVLAGRPTKALEQSPLGSPVPRAMARLALFGGWEGTRRVYQNPMLTFSSDLMGVLQQWENVLLRQMGRLPTEFDEMLKSLAARTRQISANQLELVDAHVALILSQILSCHQDLMTPDSLQSAKNALSSVMHSKLNDKITDASVVFSPAVPPNHHFRRIYSLYLSTPLTKLVKQRNKEDVGADLMSISIGLLHLLVPDRPLDPALHLVVQRIRFAKRKHELDSKLQAVARWDDLFTGQSTSLRASLVEKDIEALGREPPPPPVVRPERDQLSLLHGEFMNLLRSVVWKQPERFLLSNVAGPFHDDSVSASRRVDEASQLRSNIEQVVDRLSKGFRAYDDITVPIIRTLQALDLGIALTLDGSPERTPTHDAMVYLSEHTPLLGGRPSTVVEEQPTERIQASTFYSCFPRLEVLNTMSHAERTSLQVLGRAILNIYQLLYRDWKDQLEDEQAVAAEKSRTYHYRGTNADDQEVTDEDLQEVFPTFQSSTADGPMPEPSYVDPRQQAVRLASFQSKLFGREREDEDTAFPRLFLTSSQHLASLAASAKVQASHISQQQLLPAVFLMLEERMNHFESTPTRNAFNFYTDANVSEARKLVELVKMVKLRFSDIRNAWPEHATPQLVLGCCGEILAFKHADPVAKFLTKAEKLHAFVHEWQLVASREFSAADLYDKMTALLVSWRRLELSTWARLLDIETERCEEDAKSWWFVAYESVIAAPVEIIETEGDIEPHIQPLVATLQEFVVSSTGGQVATRLRLIKDLLLFCQLLVKFWPAMSRVASAVSNLHQHYSRFQAPVEEKLSSGRRGFEKILREQIQLASWRDTNIVALRESARRSHHKLFKVVRKYRAMLSEPAASLLLKMPDLKSTDRGDRPVEPASPLVSSREHVQRAIQICERTIGNWHARPTRFSNPLGSAASMSRLYESSIPALDVSAEVEVFVTDTVNTVAELKSQTPAKFKEDNKEFVQHLKARKRRAFADTLKTLRLMGIRSNLSTDELQKQGDLSFIFSNTPTFSDTELDWLSFANDYFHQFVDLIPRVREAHRKCSDDLSVAEITRSVGYLEGLLSFVSKQRSIINPSVVQLSLLRSHVNTLLQLQDSANDKIRTNIPQNGRSLLDVLTWLPSILRLGCTVLEVQQKYATFDISEVLTCLKADQHALVELRTQLKDYGVLPPGLTSTVRERTQTEIRSHLDKLTGHLRSWIQRFPDLEFVLRQVLDWTNCDTVSVVENTNGHHASSLNALDQGTTNLLDKIFVALQKLEKSVESFPSSIEDASWLMRSEQCQAANIKALHIEEVNSSISRVLGQLQRLEDVSGAMDTAVALLTSIMPIIEQYQNICRAVLINRSKTHGEVCRMSFVLAKTFTTIASEGFCSPADSSTGQECQEGKLEDGTGLGEGEGAEDISKDVGDDEDLSELAQQEDSKGEKEDLADAKDAVDMADEEMGGAMDNGGEAEGSDDGTASEGNEEEGGMDEEIGSVDELDPTAVDEKMWDGAQDEQEKDAENSKGEGKTDKDEAAAKSSEKTEAPTSADDNLSELSGDDEASIDQEGAPREEMDVTDPFAEQEATLEMPEDLQLDGENKPEVDTDGDEDMNELSDVPPEANDTKPENAEEQSGDEGEDESIAAHAQHEEGMDDDDAGDEEGVKDQLKTLEDSTDAMQEGMSEHIEEANDDPAGLGGGGERDTVDDAGAFGQAPQNSEIPENSDESKETGDTGQGSDGSKTQPAPGQQGQLTDSARERQLDAFKKLGDVLQKWHRQKREILKAPERQDASSQQDSERNITDVEFEHLEDETAVADTQALGAATEEQARGLDQSQAIEDPATKTRDADVLPDVDETSQTDAAAKVPENKFEVNEEDSSQQAAGAEAVNDRQHSFTDPSQHQDSELREEDELEEVDSHLSSMDLDPKQLTVLTTPEEARRLWSHYESLTRDLSLALTEQLRLILAPTLATKMRGDFRTGKRLNIKRIIPYIASQYKRDKIWMRRSVPSKRNYQIMLAVDDSKSMLESGSGQLAFETLALVAKSLSMLESGDICIVGFGAEDHVRVAHEFGRPFTSEAGAEAFQHFSFQQTYTNVRQLVSESIALFKEARNKASSGAVDLWQFELIISDGLCEDHDTIRRLVRQAQEERIMIVFVIVDAGKENSIMDLSRAIFEPDESGTGEMKLKMKKYLEGFPFPYYLIVRDVKELPQALATALKQWFAEVVDAAG